MEKKPTNDRKGSIFWTNDDDDVSQLSAEYESNGGRSKHANTLALFDKAASKMFEKRDDYPETDSEPSEHDEESLTHATEQYGHVTGHLVFGGWKMVKAATWAVGIAAVGFGKTVSAKIRSEIDKATKSLRSNQADFSIHGPYCFCGCRNLLK